MEIILIRHGKPTSAHNPVVNVVEYLKWVRAYNLSDVAENSRPTMINNRYRAFHTLSSDLTRALHSANIYQGKAPLQVDKLFREMDIPRYKLPFRLTAWHWVYLSRLMWMLGFNGPFESFKQAKHRAEIAAKHLISVAQTENKVILFGHGFMNRYIRKSLIKQGWQLNAKSNHYWGVTQLTCLSCHPPCLSCHPQ